MHLLLCDFFFIYTATTEFYTYSHTLSLPDALPILFGEHHQHRRTNRRHLALNIGDHAAVIIGRQADPDLQETRSVGQIGGEGLLDRHIGDFLFARIDLEAVVGHRHGRSEEHTSELQSLMRISYAVFCLKKKK